MFKGKKMFVSIISITIIMIVILAGTALGAGRQRQRENKLNNSDKVREDLLGRQRDIDERRAEVKESAKGLVSTKSKEKNKNVISVDKARKIASDIVNGGKVVEIELEVEDSGYEYEVEIVKDNKKHEIEIDAYTGKVLEHKTKELKAKNDKQEIKKEFKNMISVDSAKEIALKATGGGKVVDVELEIKADRAKYEVEIIKDDEEHDVEIDAYTGKVLEHEIERKHTEKKHNPEKEVKKEEAKKEPINEDNKKEEQEEPEVKEDKTESTNDYNYPDVISPGKAFDIYKGIYPGSKLKEVELELEGGNYIYEFEGYDDSGRYEIKINGSNGSVISNKTKDYKSSKGDVSRSLLDSVPGLVKSSLKDAGQGYYLDEWEVELDDGIYELEVELKNSKGGKIEYEYNLSSGALLKKKVK